MPLRVLPRASSAREHFIRARSYAGRVARLHAEVFKPTSLRTFSASVGAPWSTNITVRLRSRWNAEAGRCYREYVYHVALPSSGSFFLEEPRLFPHKGFLRGYRDFDAPRSKGRASGSRSPLVSCLTLPFLSLPFTRCVSSSAPNAAALIITSQARTTHRPGRAQGISSDRSALIFEYQGQHLVANPDVPRHASRRRRRVLEDVAYRAVRTAYVHFGRFVPCMYDAVGSAPLWSSGIGTTPGLTSFLPRPRCRTPFAALSELATIHVLPCLKLGNPQQFSNG
jgi:hypothetical protein